MLPSIAVEVASTVRLLQHALAQLNPTTIVICSSQDDFINALLAEVDSEDAAEPELLSNSLRVLAMSSQVSLVFVPEIAHLRAYLSSLTTDLKSAKSITDTRSLIIYKMLDQMRDPGNFHAQNLMRSCALAVEAAEAQGLRLILAETPTQNCHEQTEHLEAFNMDAWTESMPIIAGTTRMGEEAGSLTGRTVQIRRVVGRWCRFANLEDLT